jgi:hypothetical protein
MKLWTCYACLYERIAVVNCSSSGPVLECLEHTTGCDEEGVQSLGLHFRDNNRCTAEGGRSTKCMPHKVSNRDREFRREE